MLRIRAAVLALLVLLVPLVTVAAPPAGAGQD